MDRKLINYLPYVVRDFAEYRGITTGEQPEFELVWDAYGEVFANQFVDTALEYGLSRWEKMLGITPKGTDTLESRRAQIKAKLNNSVPYTIRAFARMLTAIASGETFELSIEPGTYSMSITTQWTASGQMEGLDYLIRNIVPCNIAIITVKEAPPVGGDVYITPFLGRPVPTTTLPELEPFFSGILVRVVPVFQNVSETKLPEMEENKL